MTHWTRREAIAGMAAAAAWLRWHDSAAVPGTGLPVPADRSLPSPATGPRIREIRLLTRVSLDAMKDFYGNRIGFPVVSQDEEQVTFQAGATRLVFRVTAAVEPRPEGGRVDASGTSTGEPMYHFAFNIPENKIRAARDWQRERTSLVPTPPHLVDPAYPDDVRHFANWNAHSIFFFDPAFNIVEYIARHELDNAARNADEFGVEDILCASEIGLVVDEASRADIAGRVGTGLGLHEYPRGSDPWAMGDAHGLLLVLGRLGELWGENTETPVRWGAFPTEVVIQGAASTADMFGDLPYRVLSDG